MTRLTSQALAHAADIVMQDLVDCLLAEHFFGSEPLPLVRTGDWQQAHPKAPALAGLTPQQRIWDWCYDPTEQRFISIALRAGITQQWEKVPGTPVLARQEEQWTVLSPEDFMKRVFGSMAERFKDNDKGLALFLDVLRTSVKQTALSLSHAVDDRELMTQDPATFFRTMEQWASLRDRPYHPLAKAKQGLDDEEYLRYQPNSPARCLELGGGGPHAAAMRWRRERPGAVLSGTLSVA